MSKLLRKILSAAVFPAALMIVSKIAGMILVNTVYDLPWRIEMMTDTWFSIQITYPDQASAILCNSYSHVSVILALAIGTGILLFQTFFLNVHFQNPKVIIRLIQFDFLLWLSEGSTIFPKLVVWLAFLWIATLIVTAQALQSLVYPWISIAGILLSTMATWLSARGFEREISTLLPEHDTLRAV